MIEQIGNALTFFAFYVTSKIGKTGLTVTIDVYNPAGSLVVTAGSASEVGGGLYKYVLASDSVTTEGEYVVVFKTADTTVDAQHIPALWTVGRAGVENLDAAISDRLAAAAYTAPDNAGISSILSVVNGLLSTAATGVATLLTRLTALRASYLDHLIGNVVVRLTAPLDPDSFALTLVSGDSYTDALERALAFEDGGQWPDLTTAAITFDIGNVRTRNNVLRITAELIAGTRVKVELTAAETKALTVSQGRYFYDLRATLGSEVFTLCTGTIRILPAVDAP